MRLAVLSDIHSNLEALEAALAEVDRAGVDRIVSCGDLVGYNADPNEVLDRLRAIPRFVSVMGNHDAVACGLEEPEGFAAVARKAAEWTRKVLDQENRAYLRRLQTHQDLGDGVFLAHGSWRDRDAYLLDASRARPDLEAFEREATGGRLLLIGHTHYPVAFLRQRGEARIETDFSDSVVLSPERLAIVNVGSVGQPRDGDPRLSLVLVDTDAGLVERRRVEYPVKRAADKVRAMEGLPDYLADRLLEGR